MTDGRGVWLYAVTADGLDPHDLADEPGIGGAPIRTLAAAGLTCVTSPVDLREFGEDALRRKLNDPVQLEAIARSHHNVVAATARAVPAVPARLATVYHDAGRVAALLAQRRADFTAVLARVTGRTEWGVRAYATAQAAAPPPAAAENTGSGTAYLLNRRAELRAADSARRASAHSATVVHTALSRLAAAARSHPPQSTQLTGEADTMVLNGAYLVDDDKADQFAATVADLAAQHLTLRLHRTGPWPAYSFAAVTEPETPT
ncbi:GvpL/GvpF family gas vesicle protein [Micromonospora sp. CPCC 206061]|uniref:GvpL/GvpF family gas vesicle protein n=1 Tax=Micromonospora sp. CPCC 206061 TaxID=3122410 RepID=UPI002FF0E8E6